MASTMFSAISQTLRPLTRRPPPRFITVKQSQRLTPNMIRLTFAGPELESIPDGCEGAHCKIMLPGNDQTREDFYACLTGGPRPVTRTYTIRHARPDMGEIDIDFVEHGDEGPASAWARRARPGSFCGLAGPGSVKITDFYADWYLVAADMSALPMAAATLEAMPRSAKGLAVFEITSEEDSQPIDAPPGVQIAWLVHPDPHVASDAQQQLVRALTWPTGTVQTCIAGESGVIRAFRQFLHNEKGVAKRDTYISGYWKIGLIEDEHQKVKRSEAAS
ncbi:MAG: siderophore-interacting protein [Pseudomonadota bacterium]